ncbi:hypothetical protein ZIOFF_002062 [Zingiber officinale]|uniref:Uncharacterized protein n=1 Tax=Zingiber officinale TaxID=94328 RepID=A0A8J5LSM8_ZINOF|nr:hypothetical protein ZIOFF_002062 [Zingiber officinale]
MEEARPAQRASGVGQKPGVDALDVERVATLGEKPELVVCLELAKADGAVERVLDAGDGLVLEDGEGVNEGLIDASVVEVEELLQLALEGRGMLRFVRAPVAVPQEVPHEEVKETGDEEDDGQDYYDQKDAGEGRSVLSFRAQIVAWLPVLLNHQCLRGIKRVACQRNRVEIMICAGRQGGEALVLDFRGPDFPCFVSHAYINPVN